MQPGLTRAVPMGIVGFIVGALVVMLLRGLQGLDPLWHAEIGFTLAAFTSAGFFVWGIGGFDPEMSAHAHEPEVNELGLIVAEPHHEEAAEEDHPPVKVLGYSMWQVSFWTILLMAFFFGLATLPGGPALKISNDPVAEPSSIGYVPLQIPFGGNVTFRGEEVLFSELTLFVMFTAFTLVSLAVAGGGIALAMNYLARGVAEAKVSDSVPLGTYEYTPPPLVARLVRLAVFVVLAVILYFAFYYVLIGLVIPRPESTRVVLSLVNAVLFAALLVYPMIVVRIIAVGAGFVARVLRGIPGFLGNK